MKLHSSPPYSSSPYSSSPSPVFPLAHHVIPPISHLLCLSLPSLLLDPACYSSCSLCDSSHNYNPMYVASLPSLLLFLLLRPRRPPHWVLQLVLVPLAFVMAIIWLNIIANEVVSVLRAFGLLLNINTGATNIE